MSNQNPAIIASHLSYASLKSLSKPFSFVFPHQKMGLVGDNGIGKTTLLRLLTGELHPFSGSIEYHSSIIYSPQQVILNPEMTVSSLLGFQEKLAALHFIYEGSIDSRHYDCLANEWDIEEQLNKQLQFFNLDYLEPVQSLNQLSGGELTKLMLTRVFHAKADFIILDEPSCHLDLESRQQLYRFIKNSQQSFLIVSHDRTLLNHMDSIIELSETGLHYYGGNYQHYQEQKNLNNAALHKDFLDAKKQLKKVERSTQASIEKRQKREARGKRAFKLGKVDRLTAQSKKGRSEKTQAKLVIQSENLIFHAQHKLNEIQQQIEVSEKISPYFEATRVAQGKKIVELRNVSFQFSSQHNFLFENLNLSLYGPERIAITGRNGVGKTTLVRLILGQLAPTKGEIYLGVKKVCYLDQHVSMLNKNLSLLENYLLFNPSTSQEDAHFALASLKFRNIEAYKKVDMLSGGERLRAGLACSLYSEQPPELIILDEPSHYLDLTSLAILEEALFHFNGALIVISHDTTFLNNIGVKNEFCLQ